MSMKEKEWDDEQHRVNSVVDKMKRKAANLERHVSGVTADIVDIRKNFWEDVTVNFENTDEAVETHASIKQQAEMLSERERSHRHVQKQLKTLKRLTQSPYFGRIDFVEDGEQSAEQIYLGVGSFFDEDTEKFLIYDWRAPISSLYYDYSLGSAQYEAPGGIITGDMTVKRQFIIRDSRIQSMFDTGVTIGDMILQEVLGNHSNTQLKSIVATIQKEQNRIIRNDRKRLLIVQGAAGSGKTSAALQRAAYLLYRFRDTLQADQIVLFSPNPLFNSYVSTVLPELGEENMQQTTFQQYLDIQLGNEFQFEDIYTQMEYTLTSIQDPGYSVRMEGIRFKATTSFMELIKWYVERLKQSGMVFKDIKFRGRTLISAAQIMNQFYQFDSSLSIPNRLQLVTEWLLKELKRRAQRERTKRWVEEEMQLLDTEAFVQAHERLQRKKQYTADSFNDFEQEEKLLAATVVKQRFKPLYAHVKQLQFVNIPAIYRQLFEEPQYAQQTSHKLPLCWQEICSQTVQKLKELDLAYEDGTPYLYLKEQIEGVQRNTSVRHVFIDEAQDYSPFQFTFLKQLFPQSKMTVLGDLNQTIHTHAAETGFSTLSSLYGNEQTEKIVLTRSYRSTKPIIEFTRQLIPEGDAIDPFNREGTKPRVTKVGGEEELVLKIVKQSERLQAEGHHMIAIICKTAEESERVYQLVEKHMTVRLVHKATTSFDTGVLVIPSYLAKGMEFDAVIIYNASAEQYGRECERKLFYTVCTRAMHELDVYVMGALSPFLTEANPDTYVMEE